MKTCTKCNVPKEESEFHKRLNSTIGLKPYCKQCASEANRDRYQKNTTELNKKSRDYAINHPEKIKEINRRSYLKNRVKVLAALRERRRAIPKGQRKKYPENVEKRRKRRYKRYWTNPETRLLECLRSRLRSAISSKSKRGRALDLLGCPLVWLEVHLESQFQSGMTWENYGPVWHIDHIKPCAKFDLTNPEQQKSCFHWTNLQPLFAEENRKKSDSYRG